MEKSMKYLDLVNAALKACSELSEVEPDSMEETRLKLRLDNIRYELDWRSHEKNHIE